jgi:hypothetical protein
MPLHPKARAICLLIATSLLLAAPAKGQTLDDYKNAKGKKYCESIPYSTLRSNCTNAAEATKECAEEKWSCSKDTEGLIASINGMKDKIYALNDQRSKVSNDDEKKGIDAQIKEISDKRESFIKQLEDEKKDIGERIERGKKCLEARKKVREIFADAKTMAKSESDNEKNPFAEELVSYWEGEQRGHDGQIEAVGKGIQKCEEIYKKKQD